MYEPSEELQELKYLWDGSEQGWVLFCLNPLAPTPEQRHVVKNELTNVGLIIEDDELYKEVVLRMKEANVKIEVP